MRVLYRILMAGMFVWAVNSDAMAQRPEPTPNQELSREERLQKIEQQKKERMEKLRERRQNTQQGVKLQQETQRERIRAYQERNPDRALPPNLTRVNPPDGGRQRALGRGDGGRGNNAERIANSGQGRLKIQTARLHNEHNLRLARLNRIKTLAVQAGDQDAITKVDALIARENAAFTKSKIQFENRVRQLEQRATRRHDRVDAPDTRVR